MFGAGSSNEPVDSDVDQHPIRFIVESSAPVRTSPLLSSVLRLGTLPTLIVVGSLLARRHQVSPGFTVGCLSAILFLNLAPYLIWRYDARLYPTFFERFSVAVADTEALEEIASAGTRIFTRQYRWVTAATAGLAVPMIGAGRPYLRAEGIGGVSDPVYWALFTVTVWLGVLIGIGFTGVLTTLYVVRKLIDDDVIVDPLHPDHRGGLGSVGRLSVRTAVLFATGSFLLPIQIHYLASEGGWLAVLLYVLVGVYTLAIFAVFAYPTFLVERRADEYRRRKLNDLRSKYGDIREQTDRLQGTPKL